MNKSEMNLKFSTICAPKEAISFNTFTKRSIHFSEMNIHSKFQLANIPKRPLS